VNCPGNQNHKVESTGCEQTAAMPPSVQETASGPTMKAENKPDIKTMPTLTVRTLKMISAACQ